MSYKKMKIINFFLNLVPGKKLRGKIRMNIFLPRLDSAQNLPMRKSDAPVNIAFAFDEGYVKPTAVAIASLLEVSKGVCDYNIYCIINNADVSGKSRASLEKLVRNYNGSNLIFLQANNDFDKSYCGAWPVSAYYRLMLPKLLPNMERIIYADGDIIFCNDLSECSRIDLRDNLIAAVGIRTEKYINSGFLIMNLQKIRRDGLCEQWVKVSQKEKFASPDQDLLNITCRDKILFLPWKYNFRPYGLARSKNLFGFSEKEYDELNRHLVVLHWNDSRKPWKLPAAPYADLWRKYEAIASRLM